MHSRLGSLLGVQSAGSGKAKATALRPAADGIVVAQGPADSASAGKGVFCKRSAAAAADAEGESSSAGLALSAACQKGGLFSSEGTLPLQKQQQQHKARLSALSAKGKTPKSPGASKAKTKTEMPAEKGARSSSRRLLQKNREGAEDLRASSSSSTEANSIGEASVNSGCSYGCRGDSCECLRQSNPQVQGPPQASGSASGVEGAEECASAEEETSQQGESSCAAHSSTEADREANPGESAAATAEEEEEEGEEVEWSPQLEGRLHAQGAKGSRQNSNCTAEAFLADGELNLAVFKVFPCKQRHSAAHDKKYCPFYHNFRDKRRYPVTYRAEQCEEHFDVDSSSLRCSKGENCKKCHNRHELLYHPSIFKQRFCSSYAANNAREFFIAHFKTIWCPYGVQHDWYTCVYAHTYQDCRRDPRVGYGSEPCPMWEKDVHSADYEKRCANGTLCPYSHGSKEQLYHPSYYKTMPCMDFRAKDGAGGGVCPRGVLCAFYHQPSERRVPSRSTVDYSRPLKAQQTALLQPLFLKPPLFNLDDFEAFGHSSRRGNGDKGGGLWPGGGAGIRGLCEASPPSLSSSKKALPSGRRAAPDTPRQRAATQRRPPQGLSLSPSAALAAGEAQLHDLRVRLQLQRRREEEACCSVDEAQQAVFSAAIEDFCSQNGSNASWKLSPFLGVPQHQQQQRPLMTAEEVSEKLSLQGFVAADSAWGSWHSQQAGHGVFSATAAPSPSLREQVEQQLQLRQQQQQPAPLQQQQQPHYLLNSLPGTASRAVFLSEGGSRAADASQMGVTHSAASFLNYSGGYSTGEGDEASFFAAGGSCCSQQQLSSSAACLSSSHDAPTEASCGTSPWRVGFSSSLPGSFTGGEGNCVVSASSAARSSRPYLKLFGTSAMWAPRDGEDSLASSSFLSSPDSAAFALMRQHQAAEAAAAPFGFGKREASQSGVSETPSCDEQLPSISLSSLHWLVVPPSAATQTGVRLEEGVGSRYLNRGPAGESRESSSSCCYDGSLLPQAAADLSEEERLFAAVPDLRRLLSATVSEADLSSLPEEPSLELQQQLQTLPSHPQQQLHPPLSEPTRAEAFSLTSSGALKKTLEPLTASEWTESLRLWAKALGASAAVRVSESACGEASSKLLAAKEGNSPTTALVVRRGALSAEERAVLSFFASNGEFQREKGLLSFLGFRSEGDREGDTSAEASSSEGGVSLCLLPPPGGERAVCVHRLSDLLLEDSVEAEPLTASSSDQGAGSIQLASLFWKMQQDGGDWQSPSASLQEGGAPFRRAGPQLRKFLRELCAAASCAHSLVLRARSALQKPPQRVAIKLSPKDVFVFASESLDSGGLEAEAVVDVSSLGILKAVLGEAASGWSGASGTSKSETGGCGGSEAFVEEASFSTGQAAAEEASLGVSLAALFEKMLQQLKSCGLSRREGSSAAAVESGLEDHLLQSLRLASAASLASCKAHPFFWSSAERLGFLEAALSLFREEKQQRRAWGLQVDAALEAVNFTHSSWLFAKARDSRKKAASGEEAEEVDCAALELLELVSELRSRWLYFSSQLTPGEVFQLLREVGVEALHSRPSSLGGESRVCQRGPQDKALLQLLQHAEEVIDCHVEVEAPQLFIQLYSAVKSAPAILEALLADPGLASLRPRLSSA